MILICNFIIEALDTKLMCLKKSFHQTDHTVSLIHREFRINSRQYSEWYIWSKMSSDNCCADIQPIRLPTIARSYSLTIMTKNAFQ